MPLIFVDYSAKNVLFITKSIKNILNATSSSEAELVALTNVLQRSLWSRAYLAALDLAVPPTQVVKDKKSTITLWQIEKMGKCECVRSIVDLRDICLITCMHVQWSLSCDCSYSSFL